MNIVTAMPPSRSSVVAAFLLFGTLNAGTPLLIASTPVSAAQPELKARSSRNDQASPARPWSSNGSGARISRPRSRPGAGRRTRGGPARRRSSR